MDYTLVDVIKQALVQLGVLAPDQTPSAEDIKTGGFVLYSMLDSWSIYTLTTPKNDIIDPIDLSSPTNPLYWPDGWLRPIYLNLAVELASSYQQQPSESLVLSARDALAKLMRNNSTPIVSQGDDAMMAISYRGNMGGFLNG